MSIRDRLELVKRTERENDKRIVNGNGRYAAKMAMKELAALDA